MKIKKSDEIPLDKFIDLSLYNKKFGYYMKKNPFGKKGDFITAPNISRLFSEIIAIWIISFWKNLGSPRNFNLIELGAGNGEMMKVLLESFKNFLFPGLIMMTIIQNAFMNNSSSILMSKVQGNIVDLLMPPLSNVEIILAFTLAGITRGLASAVACALVMMPFIEVTVYNLWIILIFAILASAIMSLIGMISGIWAEKWDHLGTVGNFVIVPLSFLSGTFYSITVLPDAIQRASLINPFFYMIDGFRFGFLGASDSSISHAFTILIIVLISLIVINYLMLKTGYKLRA